MNAWGIPAGAFDALEQGFAAFLRDGEGDALKREYYLPGFVDRMVREGRASVRVLPSRTSGTASPIARTAARCAPLLKKCWRRAFILRCGRGYFIPDFSLK